MSFKTIIDLTHTIAPGMPFYPGTEPPSFHQAFTLAKDGFAELRISLLTHSGTHLDAPAHMIETGATLDAFPVERFLGRARVADVSSVSSSSITRDTLENQVSDLPDLDYLMIHTGWSRYWGTDLYYDGFPALSEDAARWLADSGLRGVGVDAVSVDKARSKEFPIHRILLGSGMAIVENLKNLGDLVGQTFHFCCLPLKISGADGAPVRAIALLD